MSAIINPIIYMNTNKTFKKFVVNLLKCKQYPMTNTSTAIASQVITMLVVERKEVLHLASFHCKNRKFEEP